MNPVLVEDVVVVETMNDDSQETQEEIVLSNREKKRLRDLKWPKHSRTLWETYRNAVEKRHHGRSI